MAKILFGNMVADSRGSVGGIVYSRNTYGAYARQKVSPVQPRSETQLAQRALFGGLASAWDALTETRRDAWKQFGILFPATDVFGLSQARTGINAWLHVNLGLEANGLTRLNDPPVDQAVAELTSLSVAAPLAVTWAPTPLAATSYLELWGTPAHPSGRTYVKPLLRYLATVIGTAAVPYDLSAAWVAVFGNIPGTTPYKITVFANVINSLNGARSVKARADLFVP